jgi:GNAT superfamily N-acetyltransferase
MADIIRLSNIEIPYYKDQIIDIWNRNLKDSFPIQPELFERNVINSPYIDQRSSFIAVSSQHVVGMIIVKKELSPPSSVSASGLESSPLPKVWINSMLVDSSYRSKGIGGQLLATFEAELEKGVQILIGTDPHHLFPGIPAKDEITMNFFIKRGYTVTGRAYDLRTTITRTTTKYPLPEPYTVRRLVDGEEKQLLELIQNNFSTRWYMDTKQGIQSEKPLSSIIGLFEQEKIIGFAHIYTFRDEYVGPSVYWKELLKPQYGGLGPIGVAKSHQGRGLGISFFEAILDRISKEGVRDMVIDWTISLDFYGKFGFKPWKEYTHCQKQISR